METIAVLLTVHNRKEKTLNCLRRLYSQEKIDQYVVDVFLTDDGCTDGTSMAVKEEFPNVNIINGDGTLFGIEGCMRHGALLVVQEIMIIIYG